MYHLPVVSRIVQEKGFGIYDVVQRIYPHYNVFPKNAELLFAYNFLFLKTDRFLEIVQIPFIIFSVLSIYSISRYLKISPKNSLWALSFPFIPIVFQQAISCYIDLIFSSLVIMSINFLIKKKPLHLLFSIISASLALGTKGTGIPFFIVAVIFIIVLNYRKIFNRRKIFIFLFISLSLGGHFYIRNTFLFRSPVGDYEISIGKIKIKKGEYKIETEKRSILATIFEIPPSNERYLGYYTYDTRAGGFGPLFAIFYLPALFFSLIIGVLKKDKKVLILFLILIFVYILFPYKWWTRFHIYFAGISIVFFCYTIQELPNFFPIIPFLILIFSSIASTRGIFKSSIQNYFPYNFRKLYLSEFNDLMGGLKTSFLPKIKKNDTIFFYYAPLKSLRYSKLTDLSYNFMLPDYSSYHRYIFSLKDEGIKNGKWIITPAFIKPFSRNYTLIYEDKDVKVWRRK